MKNALKKIGNFLANAKEFICGIGVSLMVFMMSTPILASDISNSKIATGTKKLVEDATTWLLIIAPIVTILAVGYYFIRKAISDEMDHRKWNTRISTAIISCVGVVTASVIIKVVMAYFQ